MHFKMKKLFLAFLIVPSLLSPAFAFAEDASSPSPSAASNLCSRIDDVTATISKAVSDREVKHSADFNKGTDQTLKSETATDAKLDAARTKADTDLSAAIDSLSNKAKNDQELQAINDFKTAVQNSLSARRTAVDTAVSSYRDGYTALLAARNASSTAAYDDFRSSVDVVLSQAKTDCQSEVSTNTVRTNLVQSLQAAETALKNFQSGEPKFLPLLQALEKSRKDSVNKAFSDYASSVAKAKTALLSAFPTISLKPTPVKK